ncbi:phospholipase [Longibacter salinarum]|uniref:Phospholipase n=1 Tax=Longibacter salinarum TaxID=1850348 RepID=A0A2A8CZT7_9BACT|nr:dienelactone hydrolase family protein [Longibacter salinarum]PEN14239.1 phospholipase [Longibacter salinarum]
MAQYSPSNIDARSFLRVVTTEHQGRFLVRFPEGYRTDPSRRWPFLLFLHGAGERGRDLNLVQRHGPLSDSAPDEIPAIIVAPQCDLEDWWNAAALEALVESCLERYRVDEARMALTGISMGGSAAWELAARTPERWTAVAPICGRADPLRAPSLVDVPVWAFHGAQDTVIPAEQSKTMVDAIRSVDGEAKLTIDPDAAHEVWTDVYRGTEIYDWLLKPRD